MYGLRNAPRAWYKRVRKDLEALGWRCHQLDQCVFLKYDGEELVGVCGVYVDDFIIAGKPNGKKWQIEKDKLKKLYKWGNGNLTHLHFAESDTFKRKTIPLLWISRNSLGNSRLLNSIYPKPVQNKAQTEARCCWVEITSWN